MKVLMIEHFLPESIYSLELGRELKKYCELSVLCSEKVQEQEQGIEWLPQMYAGGKGKIAAMLSYGKTLWRVKEIIHRGHFDIVHIQTFKNAEYEIMLYKRLRKYVEKFVHTVHNILPHEVSPKDYNRYKMFYDMCDELIVHNKVSGDCLMKLFHVPESKITVIAHGAYQSHMKNKETGNVGTEKTGSVIEFLQFGNIRKYKGIDILLDAVELLEPEVRKQVHFTIAGRQYPKLDETDYQRIIREKELQENVSFLEGYIPEEELSEVLEKSDFMLFPYREIYGSGALLMAYSYGKPVIVSDIPAFLEETDTGRTGIVFESENPRALAEAIEQAVRCGENERKKYQTAIGELVSQKYNWKKSAVKTAEIYNK